MSVGAKEFVDRFSETFCNIANWHHMVAVEFSFRSFSRNNQQYARDMVTILSRHFFCNLCKLLLKPQTEKMLCYYSLLYNGQEIIGKYFFEKILDG